MDLSKMIFITGFARGGTSWLRDCVAAHPEVAKIPHEMVIFRDSKGSREYIKKEVSKALSDLRLEANYFVNKAPANAPYLGEVARICPESKFIFIIRDPRDVFISHKRGTKKWMDGPNKTVNGCMKKIESYYQGWVSASNLENVLLVRYEDLHQNFIETMKIVFTHIGIFYSDEIIVSIYKSTNFSAQTNRANNKEQRDAAKRKGVIGDWGVYLDKKERDWYIKSTFWNAFFIQHGYSWRLNTFENILKAMKTAGVYFLNEEDLLNSYLYSDRINIVVQHDIDYLNKSWCEESVIRSAHIEGENSIPAHYNFLPMNDPRYGDHGPQFVPEIIRRVKKLNPYAEIGFHVNACEKFYPPKAPCAGNKIENIDEIIASLHSHIDAYEAEGIYFKVATAHGYGRGKKLPNNRDTKEIALELEKRGITLFDTHIRDKLKNNAALFCALTDVGGVIKPKKIPGGFDLIDPKCYANLPPSSFMRFLTHPGNYSVDSPSTISMRVMP